MTAGGTPPQRRRGDRREGDRRALPRFSPSQPWHGTADLALGSGFGSATTDRPLAPDDADGGPAEQGPPVAGEGAALLRILRIYMVARGALAVVLVMAPWMVLFSGGQLPLTVLLICLAYAGQALALWLLPGLAGDNRPAPDRLSRSQWAMTIGVDMAAFSLLRLVDPTSHLNYAALLVLPVLMAGVLTRRLTALASAALVTLVLLAGALISATEGDVLLQLSQAGLASAGLFVIAVLTSELAQRLATEERAARGNRALAYQQTQLNRVVIEEMTEGVLVVDQRGAVRALNPAAQALLGPASARQAPPFGLALEPAWRPLQAAIADAFLRGMWPDDARELAWALPDGQVCRVQVRVRFTRRSGIGSGIGSGIRPAEDYCVLFLEELRVAQARSRQEKLAAMGRMSAGIAHEIRNPLAAVAQANALLREDGLPPEQDRLARIVDANVERLKRIVDDVMAVAPGAAQPSASIDARAELLTICRDWLGAAAQAEHATVPADPGQAAAADLGDSAGRLQLSLPSGPLPVLFDPEHLRRVLVNLLDNADRHASQSPGAIMLWLHALPGQAQAELVVASDGSAIPPEVERYLFEPFFSTRSRGSGLGLYICRELCERHGASIEFRHGVDDQSQRNAFRVLLRRSAQR